MTILRKRVCVTALVILAWWIPFGSRAADNSVHLREIVDAAIRPLTAEHDVPGMAVAVTVRGRAVFFNHGLASREDRRPVNRQTLFEIGSVSKTLTATLAAQAQALGMLSLDDRMLANRNFPIPARIKRPMRSWSISRQQPADAALDQAATFS